MAFSVAVIAQDESDRIASCIESVACADEIVVVDSGSRDNTMAIAAAMGCQVISRAWHGYARQKQFAVDQCRNDWVLILDADERVPAETVAAISRLTADPAPDIAAYGFLRKNYFHGRWIRRCGWWPNRVVRLVNRRKGAFSDNLVHEHWSARGIVQDLDAVIVHYSFRDYAGLIEKMQIYSTLAAKEMLANGNHGSGGWTPIAHGAWMFFRTWVLKLGILEGFDGFMISLLNAGGSFMKYAKLREARLHEKTHYIADG